MEKKAFYINAYNLLVIHRIAVVYPVGSPMDDRDFFGQVQHEVAGEKLTLNELEKERLLGVYKDARLHFVLVCAARSCPPLANFALRPDELERQLTLRTRSVLNDCQWLKVDQAGKRVGLSKICEGYATDFGGPGRPLIEWINRFWSEPIPMHYAVTFYEYDWSLNDR